MWTRVVDRLTEVVGCDNDTVLVLEPENTRARDNRRPLKYQRVWEKFESDWLTGCGRWVRLGQDGGCGSGTCCTDRQPHRAVRFKSEIEVYEQRAQTHRLAPMRAWEVVHECK